MHANCFANIASIPAAADVTVGDVLRTETKRLCSQAVLTARTCFDFVFLYKCCAKSMEYVSLFEKIGINYRQTIISMKLMKTTVLYAATMKGGR